MIAGRGAPLSAFRHGERCTLLAPLQLDVLKMLQRAYQLHVAVCIYVQGVNGKAIILKLTRTDHPVTQEE